MVTAAITSKLRGSSPTLQLHSVLHVLAAVPSPARTRLRVLPLLLGSFSRAPHLPVLLTTAHPPSRDQAPSTRGHHGRGGGREAGAQGLEGERPAGEAHEASLRKNHFK